MPVPLVCRFRSSAGIFVWHLPAQRGTTTEVGHNAFLRGVVIVGATQKNKGCLGSSSRRTCSTLCRGTAPEATPTTATTTLYAPLLIQTRGLRGKNVWTAWTCESGSSSALTRFGARTIRGGFASGSNGWLVVSMPERAFIVDCL